MTTLNGNIFREAKELLKTKPIEKMSQEEVTTVKAAMIPLDILPELNGMTTDEGLDELAKILDEANGSGVAARNKEVKRWK